MSITVLVNGDQPTPVPAELENDEPAITEFVNTDDWDYELPS